MVKKIAMFMCLLAITSAVFAQPSKQYTTWLTQEMKRNNVPGVSIAIIKNYQVKWAMGFGVADKKTGRPVTADTLFQAASISKPVTAFAVMESVQQDKLRLNENINEILTSWKLPDNKYTKKEKVTLRQLLSHSAGINVHGFGGYVIIQQTLLDVYKKPFPEIMNQLVLIPLNMTNSRFQQPLSESLMDNIAIPYRQNGEPVKGGPHTYVELAAAGLWTTPTDLAKFAISIQHSLKGEQNQLLTPKYAKLMVTPVVADMGLGLFNSNKYADDGSRGNYFSHGELNEGYRNMLIASIKDGNGAIIMTNMSPDNNVAAAKQSKNKEDFNHAVIKKIADMENWR